MSKKLQPAARVRRGTRRQRRAQARKQAAKRPPVTTGWRLILISLAILRSHWKLLGGVFAVYLILSLAFGSGFTDLKNTANDIKANLSQNAGDSKFEKAAAGVASLAGSFSAGSSDASYVMQITLFVLASLALIWSLRQSLAGKVASIKDAYYRGPAPLVPFIIVLAAIFLSFLPMALGLAVLDAALSTVVDPWGVIIFGGFCLASILLSLYLVSSSLLASYIVTLPNMKPLAALRSAHNLARFRRLTLLKKTALAAVFVAASVSAITIPLILLVPALVAPVFFVLMLAAVFFTHVYLYSLYRSMLA